LTRLDHNVKNVICQHTPVYNWLITSVV